MAAFAELFKSSALPPLMQVSLVAPMQPAIGLCRSLASGRGVTCLRVRARRALLMYCQILTLVSCDARKQEGAMEARVLKHYLLLHDAVAEGDGGVDRCSGQKDAPVGSPVLNASSYGMTSTSSALPAPLSCQADCSRPVDQSAYCRALSSAEEKLKAARATFGASSCHLLCVNSGGDAAGRDVPWADFIGAPLAGGGAGEAPERPPTPPEARLSTL